MEKSNNKPPKKVKVLGVCYKNQNLKRYILWALKLLEDMPLIFETVEFRETPIDGFDVYLVDSLSYKPLPNALIINF